MSMFFTAQRLDEFRDEILPRHGSVGAAVQEARGKWGRDFSPSQLRSKFVERYGDHMQDHIRPAPEPAQPVTQRRLLVSQATVEADLVKAHARLATPRRYKARRGISAALFLSDSHYGRDTEATRRRIGEVPQRVSDALRGLPVAEVVAVVLGDMADGEGVFPGQEMSLDAHVAQQVRTIAGDGWQCFCALSEIAPVRVACVPGNHGSTGKWRHPESNWDRMVYLMWQVYSSADATHTIPVQADFGQSAICEVQGSRGYLRHGRHVPAQADTRAARDKFRGWARQSGASWIAYAHHHHAAAFEIDRGLWGLRNGRLCGGPDDLAERLSVSSSTSQLLVLFDGGPVPVSVEPLVWS